VGGVALPVRFVGVFLPGLKDYLAVKIS